MFHLVFVRPLAQNYSEEYEYEMMYSENPDNVWGEDWNEQCPRACGEITPDMTTIDKVERYKTTIPFMVAQKNSCFSMQDCIDGIMALAWEDISEYDAYPEPYRIVLKFGETYDTVQNILSGRLVETDFDVEEDEE